jgi:hypothetical protein
MEKLIPGTTHPKETYTDEEEPTVSAWIKELENNFKHKNHDAGDLIEYNGDEATLTYRTPNNFVMIGYRPYTIQQLQDLINHMRKYQDG